MEQILLKNRHFATSSEWISQIGSLWEKKRGEGANIVKLISYFWVLLKFSLKLPLTNAKVCVSLGFDF